MTPLKLQANGSGYWDMPTGSGDTFQNGSNHFNPIIQRDEATIAATFYGHTHKDEFEIS